MRPRRFFLIIAVLLFSISVSAQTSITQNTLLWRISGNGLEKPSYLFGTIHLTDKRVFMMGDSVLRALEETEGIATELNMEEAAAYYMQVAVSDAIKKEFLEDNTSDETFRKYREALAHKLRKPADKLTLNDILERKHSWTKKLQGTENMHTFLDAYLYGLTKKQGKWTGGIEDLADQTNLMNKVSTRDLEDAIATDPFRAENASMLEKLIGIYQKEDLNAVEELILKASEDSLGDAILIRRNYKMSGRIDSLAHQRSTFFATGAAHLPGTEGLITLLRKKGFSVQPVVSSKKNDLSKYKFTALPAEWIQFKDTLAGFSFYTPGKTEKINFLGAFDMHFYFDIFENTAFYGMAVTGAPSLAKSAPMEALGSMAKEMFRAGKLTDSANITLNGVQGREYSGDLYGGKMRVRLFIRQNKVFAFAGIQQKTSAERDSAERRFFSSAVIDPPKETTVAEKTHLMKTPTGALVKTPALLVRSEEMSGPDDEAWTVETKVGMHLASGTYLMVISKTINKKYYIANDSIIYYNLATSLGETLRDSVVEEKIINGKKWLFHEGKSADDKDVFMRGTSIVFNNSLLMLMAIGDAAELQKEPIKRFLHDVDFPENTAPALRKTPVSEWGLSLLSPDPILKDETQGETPDFYAYDSSTHTTYSITLDTIGKYNWYPSDSSLWEHVLSDHKENFDITEAPVYTTGAQSSMEFTGKVKGSFNSWTRIRYILKNNTLATLTANGPSEQLRSHFNTTVFHSFNWDVPERSQELFASKADRLLADLQSPDSSLRYEAYMSISTLPGTEAVRQFLRKALLLTYQSPFENKRDAYINNQLAKKLAAIHDPGIVSFARESLATHHEPEVRAGAFVLLAATPTNESYKALAEWMEKGRPHTEVPSDLSQLLLDSTGLTKQFYAAFMQSSADSALCMPLIQLSNSLLHMGKISPKEIIPYEQHFSAFVEKHIKGQNEEEPDYRIWSFLRIADSLATPALLKATEQLLQHKNSYLKKEAAMLLLKKKKKVPSPTLKEIAASKTLRMNFYEELEELQLVHLFPSEFLTRRAMAEGSMYYHASDGEEEADSVALVSEKTGTYNKKKYHFLLYKITYGTGEDAVSYLGVSGGYTLNSKDIFPMKEVSGIYWEEEFDASKLDNLLKKYLDFYYENAD
ncbi:MAG: TraB/GumN family protein [Chitinophagaceae bacterium]